MNNGKYKLMVEAIRYYGDKSTLVGKKVYTLNIRNVSYIYNSKTNIISVALDNALQFHIKNDYIIDTLLILLDSMKDIYSSYLIEILESFKTMLQYMKDIEE